MGGLGPCVSIVGWVGLGEEKMDPRPSLLQQLVVDRRAVISARRRSTAAAGNWTTTAQ